MVCCVSFTQNASGWFISQTVRVVGEVVEGTSTADGFDTDALGEVGRGLCSSGLPKGLTHCREVFYVCAAASYSDDAFLEASCLPAQG